MTFLRFVIESDDRRTGEQMGVFTAIYALEREGRLNEWEQQWLVEAEHWLNEHLARPSRLSSSRKPGARSDAITWLKASATEHVSRMRDLARILSEKGVAVKELRTGKPGYVVYEDDHQVAAVPFADKSF